MIPALPFAIFGDPSTICPVPQKRQIRELAIQILFAWDAHGSRDDVMAIQLSGDLSNDASLQSRAIEIAGNAWDARTTTDPWLERVAPQWPPRRQPGVDRAILRLAVWELTSGMTPPKVAIDEAIELSKAYSTENSPSFVNGVLDAILREHAALTQTDPTPLTPDP